MIKDGIPERVTFRDHLRGTEKTLRRFSPDTPIGKVIRRMLERKEYKLAVMLLFGCPGGKRLKKLDPVGYKIFMALWKGPYPNLLENMVREHRWLNRPGPKRSSFTIEIYPGEYLVFVDVATVIALKAIAGSKRIR